MTKEGGPRALDQEQIPPPNLFEIYGDSEITVFGMTGTIRSLAEKCPVDLSLASIDAVNEFVVKAVNESELEIKPEHIPVFDQILDKKGTEAKYKVAEPSAPKETEHRIKVDNPVEKTIATAEIKLERPSKVVMIEVPLDKNSSGDLKLNRRLDQDETHVAAARVVEKIDAATVTKQLPIAETFSATTEDMEQIESVAEMIASPVIEGIIFQAERPTVTQSVVIETKTIQVAEIIVADKAVPEDSYLESTVSQTELPLNEEPSQDDQQLFQELFSSIVEAESPPNSPATDWESELSNGPEVIYDNFLGALSSFTELLPTSSDNEISAISEDNEDLESVEPITAPAIVLTVTERLAELEPDARESVAIVLKNIVGAIHGLDILTTSDAQPERIQEVMTQLEDLCVMLFENIGIDYDEADIKQFIEVMIHPDFYLAQGLKDDDTPLDLEHLGMHEVKLHFPKLLGSFIDIEESIKHALGAIALIASKSNGVLSNAT